MTLRLEFAGRGFEEKFQALIAMKREASQDVEAVVDAILRDVSARGDAALIDYTRRFDRLALEASGLRVSEAEIEAAIASCPRKALDALDFAKQRIFAFHQRQLPRDDHFTDAQGVKLGLRWTPIEAVGLYVPGGTASYPSSVLMNAVPAKVAGVKRIVMVAPSPDGRRNPLVLAAARLAGIDEIYRIGGAQAVGALAYGTASIAKVAKIVGPGNAYVAAAKRAVFGLVGIDSIAGPSEVVVLADRSANPDWVALDLLAQAEHDAAAQSILISDDAALIHNAGAIFLGHHTPEAIGDYVGGPNHVLPTARTARFSSGLGVIDFMKRTTLLDATRRGLAELAPAAIALAEAEGLDAHARSVAARLNWG